MDDTLHLFIEVLQSLYVDLCDVTGRVFLYRFKHDKWAVAEANDLLRHDAEEACLSSLTKVFTFDVNLRCQLVGAAALGRIAWEHGSRNFFLFYFRKVCDI